MGDILDLIKTRRNVKYFLPKFVSWENISRVIDAGRHAPSCGNIQNWKFIVVMNPDSKQQLAELAHQQYEIIQAPVLIVVCSELEKAERYYGVRGEKLYSIQNCAAAIQNMLLEAHSLGLATRWIGAFNDDEVKEMLNIPAEISVQAIIALGYAKEVPPKPPKFPLESLVFFGSWRNRLKDPAKYLNDIATILGRKTQASKETIMKGVDFVKEKVEEKVKDFKEKNI
ncbi:MAG: nitroreductase family protein [Nanoarchaeota archaeon]|nr:nitroreductase family protein [Nanoarchaeota archaeon]MBU1632701.1 nitroreductase family protein [Nanoarchaeota archaeon]MBU1876277.1 nitroreductase family protein [Nanoarchaeota archaeon]